MCAMLKDVLEERGLSVYKVAKETQISYSTLNDIVIEKTDIKKTSAEILYRLSMYLNLSMEKLYSIGDDSISQIYIHNKGRDIIVETNQFRHQYLGPKNLVSFRQINQVENDVIYVDAVFRDDKKGFIAEEDYIDLKDVLQNDANILNYKYSVQIGNARKWKKKELIDESLMVSDNSSIKMYFMPGNIEPMVEVRSMSRTNNRAIVRLRDNAIIETNMSVSMQNRAQDAVRRNKELIYDESVMRFNYA